MPRTPCRGKRGRSPTANAPRHGRTLRYAEEPNTTPCGCHAAARVQLLEARVAELEAELRRTTALLPAAVHDDPDVETLRRCMVPPGGPGSYVAAALRSVWRARFSNGCLSRAALAMPVECVMLDPAVTVSWCVPHAVVPSVVAARVVAPFTRADLACIGSVNGIVPMDTPACAQIEALHALFVQSQSEGQGEQCFFKFPPLLKALVCKLCAARLPKTALGRLAGVLALAIFEGTTTPRLLSVWCQFRQGEVSLDVVLAEEQPVCSIALEARDVFCSQVAVDEFFLPAARVCAPAQIDNFRSFLKVADMKMLAAVEFRDHFFTRLAHTPGIDLHQMSRLAFWLEETADLDPAVFLEPQFILDFCAQGMRECLGEEDERESGHLVLVLARLLSKAAAMSTGERLTSLAQSARDMFFVPAVKKGSWFAIYSLTEPLKAITREPSSAALFCTADYCDRFFVRLLTSQGDVPDHVLRIPPDSAPSYAEALANIAATAPLAQRQALFATAEFRDTVMAELVRCARRSQPRSVAAVRAALRCIAVNDDGSLHEVFARGYDYRCLASEPPSGSWAFARDSEDL